MSQEVFRFHLLGRDFPIYGFGLMLVAGLLAATQLVKFLARRTGQNPDLYVNAGLLALLSGVVGSRLSHVLENLGEFTRSDLSVAQNLWNMVNITSGGLTFYGGLIVATAVLVGYARYKKVPLFLGMDVIAPTVMVGLALGRIGCFLNGCCYGERCELPLAVRFPYNSPAYIDQVRAGQVRPEPRLRPTRSGHLPTLDDLRARDRALPNRHDSLVELARHEHALPVHPAQLYSAFNAALLAALLTAYFTVPHIWGRGFALMLMLYGASRFLLELLRVEPAVLGPLSFSMVLTIVLAAAGAGLWIIAGRLYRHPRPPSLFPMNGPLANPV